jgi:IS4 transposase
VLWTLGRDGRLPFAIHDSSKNEAAFTIIVCWSKRKLKLMPLATNIDGGNAKRLVKTIPLEYRRRWEIETSFSKVKEVYGRMLSPSSALRLSYFMTAMILYNLWQAVNLMLRRGKQHNDGETKRNDYWVTKPFMLSCRPPVLNSMGESDLDYAEWR